MEILRPATLIPILIALFALVISAWSVFVSSQARSDARAVMRLDLTPDVRLQALLNQVPALLWIRNEGPVDVVQLEVAVIYIRYLQSTDRRVLLTGSDQVWRFDRLKPREMRNAEVSKHDLDVNARLEQPLRNNALVVRLAYRRDSDLREVAKEAYYFLNPEGRWVGENDSSIAIDDYKDVRSAVMERRLPEVMFDYLGNDALHDVEPNR